jgi:hypothetical protein
MGVSLTKRSLGWWLFKRVQMEIFKTRSVASIKSWLRLIVSQLLHRLVTSATCCIHPCLIVSPLLDLIFVNSPFAFLLLDVWAAFLWTSISPHFTKKSRNIGITHIRVVMFNCGTTRLRVLEKGRHGSLGGKRVFLGASLWNRPGSFVGSLLSDEPVFATVIY